MLVSRPPSSMEGITEDFQVGLSGRGIDTNPLSPIDTRGGTTGYLPPLTPAPHTGQMEMRSTLQDILAGPGARASEAAQDLFNSGQHTPQLSELLFRSGSRGNKTQYLDKYCAAMSLDVTSRKQLQRLLEVRPFQAGKHNCIA